MCGGMTWTRGDRVWARPSGAGDIVHTMAPRDEHNMRMASAPGIGGWERHSASVLEVRRGAWMHVSMRAL